MPGKTSDSIFHPPNTGSNVPGKVEANPYVFYPPDAIRDLIPKTPDGEELEKMKSALRQWERQYQWPCYPWKKVADRLRYVAACMHKLSEIVGPAQNINYYQDAEVPEGYEGILDDMRGLYDNDNAVRFDIPRQGERPVRDIDIGVGDFSAPKEPLFQNLKPSGDGVDPEGMEVDNPPTGGDIEGWPEGI